jgi:hypothetical protein
VKARLVFEVAANRPSDHEGVRFGHLEARAEFRPCVDPAALLTHRPGPVVGDGKEVASDEAGVVSRGAERAVVGGAA